MPGVTSTYLADHPERALLDLLEEYYDAVPRHSARVEDHGPLTLFVREGQGWPFYARPARGRSGSPAPADVHKVRARQRELGIPESFEWVAETTPTLRAAVEESGLVVHEHPLMVLDPRTPAALAEEWSGGVSVRIVDADDPVLPSALAVPHLAFAEPGTHVGLAGEPQLAEAVEARGGDGSVQRVIARIRAGLTVVAAAVEHGSALSAGQHQPLAGVSEIVGVGTLPAARRRGLALAVTAALVADARSRGAETVFLSAGDDDVARIYARLGFRKIGTALIAEPAEQVR
ncbi:GNAT family N-acetyltransferase [Streptomyces resistomycificus]|uniref:Acetyltransferase n=1 Tax=Streptomyces resistomycificus TaxID=67356 RepID=A0A0L8LGG5_9ACTN|nr:GNAT family N-acetyltransferase [Streptomyces resistomycificus]KOG37194.1 acetyltransferase [Streptomyces resistomycificus]KUN95151.1 acetyltransferase [Streptomyces resistomycificus]